MSVFEKFVLALQVDMNTPSTFGAWHLISFLLMIAVTAFLILRYRDADDKTVRRIFLVFWILIAFLELYKQLVFSMSSDGTTATWEYELYSFPFQFCSSPLYVLPFVIFSRDGKVRDAAIAFLCSFSLFAGLAVMIYPGDVFISYIGINIQTMVHHGSQVALGVFLAVHNRRRFDFRFFAHGIPLFAALAAVALLMNISVYHLIAGTAFADHTFNMFFISPYFDCTLPVLSAIQPLVPYPIFLMIYLLGFTLAAAVVFGIVKGVFHLTQKEPARDQA